MNLLREIRARFASALSPLGVEVQPLLELILPSKDAAFGDYQANCAMPLGKRLGRKPREVAEEIIAKLEVADLCEPPEVAGPGFINLRVRDDYLLEQLHTASGDLERLGVESAESPRTVVLDFSSPNVAKPMHVGHIRSTVIGDALCRVLRFLGEQVISDNHIGDWGAQFGMIIYGYKHFVDEAALAEATVPELTRLYKLVNQLIEHHDAKLRGIPELEAKIEDRADALAELESAEPTGDKKADKQAAKKLKAAQTQLAGLRSELTSLTQKVAEVEADPRLSQLAAAHPNIGTDAIGETAKLHAGNAENQALWERFLPACLAEINATYDRLGVTFDHTLGESFYQPLLAGVVEDLTEKGLATESDGAMCVFTEGHAAPFIVRKKDGAFLYATTDLATIKYRMQEWKPDALLYVVDHRQGQHFDQLFATARLWGYEDLELQHVAFGTVMGEDGRPYKTRSGASVGLMGLLDEAVDRARAIADKSEVLASDDERQEVAERIGIGAIKYADLSHNRTSDYVFSYDKMLAMNGNTAAYMQYSCARVRGIFAKGDVDVEELRASGAKIVFSEPAERALGIALLRFSEALERVASDYRPNHLTAYLFELASRYSEFFVNCPVLKAETEELKQSRLLLCDLVARTIECGLGLLGIRTVERM
ncbi:Arginine--tRNA ligase [Posidoniimonas polymericola]|uniref:Arginine--tRNA ligase n=1 Tax=Posidoniimonas polymericola TaxID=2528002 RepID=A0A5C5YDB5_9BACT|nr:arginine--tRNA ligase [Posidoniimonas polymericola]TWT73717.1 Arginine--tRNA ligase [Posidoniimonas polymericola]